jgi:hypothetical protein
MTCLFCDENDCELFTCETCISHVCYSCRSRCSTCMETICPDCDNEEGICKYCLERSEEQIEEKSNDSLSNKIYEMGEQIHNLQLDINLIESKIDEIIKYSKNVEDDNESNK